ncbi:hypothetical protein KAOT1_21382 [Kordia algicida OT-1]|uniref:Uncharacterized protein n=2 Tax=Kordia TaxID=221065 RepID=A9DMP6_9FLAO|nr:hypothetical protein KAOT1_21382 [Kordia algicida OT-1]
MNAQYHFRFVEDLKNKKMITLKELHRTLQQRKRPEDVAEMILELLGERLSFEEKRILEKAAKGSLKNTFLGYTSMMQEFATAVGAEKQVKKTIEIFKLTPNESIDYNNIDAIKEFIAAVSPIIFKEVGANNFLSDRLNKLQRKEKGLDLSKRNYNKKWRLLKRLEKKLTKLHREIKKIEFQKIGKHGLSHKIEFSEFQKDYNSACFIAYYNTRCNLRSVFTNTSQERAFDEISEMLLNRCKANSANWWAIAHIYSGQKVITKLSDEQKGKLLGKWTGTLQEIAEFLAEIWNKNDFNRETMVVQRGNDSTTWNNTAGAWNKARDNWMNIIYALGMEYILDEICFGKVLRLMAGDVVAWHYSSGGQLDPNTEVWNKIPLPWEVFQGKEKCTKKLVEWHCKRANINPTKSGWIAPRVQRVAKFKPTPELVHGVTISNPYLATVLKKHKYFSGKKYRLVQW